MEQILNPDDWQPSDGIVLEDDAVNSIKCLANTLVLAGPGAGKTEMLAQKVDYLFKTGKCLDPFNVLAISFKKDAATNLKDRVAKRIGDIDSRRFVSLTFDAFAKKIVDQYREWIPEGFRPTSNYEISYKKVENLKSQEVWKNAISQNPSKLTFSMILVLAIYTVKNNHCVKSILSNAFPFVFVDEFQDTTSLQYSLLKECFFSEQNHVTAVGDNKQQIMVWAGADKGIFRKFQKDFKPKKFILKENHRSAKKIVKLESEMQKIMGQNSSNLQLCTSNEEGAINLIKTDNIIEEAEFVGKLIQKDINQNKISIKNIAILVRRKPKDYVKQLVKWLNKRNIRTREEDKYQKIINEPMSRIVIYTILSAIQRIEKDDWKEYIDICINLFKIDPSDAEEFSDLISKVTFFGKRLYSSRINIKTNYDKNYLREIISCINVFFKLGINYPQYNNYKYFQNIENSLISFLYESFQEVKNNGNIDNMWVKVINEYLGENTIPILTIHKSKGLEYDSVYLIGLEDYAFVPYPSNYDPEEIKKSFYVAISRAKKYLTVTFCKHRDKYREEKMQKVNELYQVLKRSGVVDLTSI